ncbi:hypothetical protein AMES_8083 [Amycolatopsis mediterranei S699]|uniref:Uncharacterized protein n=2 Tax=Amycolatopsis mediterranei TaxID=33910 RepID=A0A0H3DIF4_AMYMU|nr:hypothetical protein [Amycolatopsis mediterranei]ADJ49908.1 conserved hypothetical protein [Amycolatopsis mediterranei U32]AEK46900.1 hypothetical protein RAM_42165 [Amycolatopsis mediterranei S699]AFO81616.1 hypothetical protein AMES_8083 [Amycolatopsis mediterranei S699]AGT88745.1 hypothetical protein B737_8084 [Amycolatopsis mediterranei RB]KDO07843.1 hypothetical protein DV26_26505 [Amycolatopsis mediterranei]
MRWAALYARSRQLPAAFGALLVATCGVWFLGRDSWNTMLVALALTTAVAVAAIGLSGQDPDLDRTAALPWPARRFAHLALIAIGAGVVVLGVQELGSSAVAASIIVRDAAGLAGLAGLAATIAGGQFGWTLPLAWSAVSPFVPHDESAPSRVLTWLLQPAQTPAATWTAVILAVTGAAVYTTWGGRR